MGVSACGQVMVSAGATETVTAGPVLLTSVVVAETTGSAAAAVVISDGAGVAQLLLAAPAGGTVTWCPCEPAALDGLAIACQVGDAVVSFSWR